MRSFFANIPLVSSIAGVVTSVWFTSRNEISSASTYIYVALASALAACGVGYVAKKVLDRLNPPTFKVESGSSMAAERFAQVAVSCLAGALGSAAVDEVGRDKQRSVAMEIHRILEKAKEANGKRSWQDRTNSPPSGIDR